MSPTPQPVAQTATPTGWGRRRTLAVGWAALIVALGWSYYSAMALLVGRWCREPDYSYGFFVPPFALYLLWVRRRTEKPLFGRGSLWGLLLLGLAAALRWASAYFYYGLMDPFSLIPCLAGVVLLVGGWSALRWAWPSIAFLVFMIPLPGFLADTLGRPLQRVGTIASTYLVQTLGIPAVAQGNVILLTNATVGVAEACSGLRMFMLFSAVSVGTAFLMQRSLIEKTIIVLSAPVIAVAVNVARITVTSILHEAASHELAEAVFHDWAGWLMMPLAILLLWVEIAVLARLVIDASAKGPVPLEVTSPG
ncbi:MAG TPA: exosortase/archaeosortase family protein [Planctomycetes bacterium]|nr:exosortase/archaeosortase family protein [Planctomycetota bacterium]